MHVGLAAKVCGPGFGGRYMVFLDLLSVAMWGHNCQMSQSTGALVVFAAVSSCRGTNRTYSTDLCIPCGILAWCLGL